MSLFDYLPHRLMINKALKKESERLKKDINQYKINYEIKLSECNREIQKAINDRNKIFDKAKETMLKNLSQYKEKYDSLFNDLIQYIDLFYQQQMLVKTKAIYNAELSIIQEQKEFLNGKISLINEELVILKERNKELKNQVDVSDLIALIQLSDIDCDVSLQDDVDGLMNKIESLSYDTYTINRLKNILMEKSEYNSEIKYIQWVIQQKESCIIMLKKDISINNRQKNFFQKKLRQADNEYKNIKSDLLILSLNIRNFWMVPIVENDLKKNDKSEEKNKVWDRIKRINSNIDRKKTFRNECCEEKRRMALQHSSENDKWERLTREIKDVSEEMRDLYNKREREFSNLNSIKGVIESLEKDKSYYIKLRNDIYNSMKKNEIRFYTPNLLDEELRILNTPKFKNMNTGSLRKSIQERKNQKKKSGGSYA